MAEQGGRTGEARTSSFSPPQAGGETGDLLDLRLRAFLDLMASEDPTPGGGSAAAVAVAMSVGLSGMVARASPDWAEAGAAAAQAEHLRGRVAPLVQLDAELYEEALVTLRLPRYTEAEVRSAAIRGALERAAEAPLLIAEAAADAACLAADVAERGTADRRGDAVAAALLAEAAARAAATLVAVNLVVSPEDYRVARSETAASTATEAARRAVASVES